ncbi:uncharacterized protein [Notamacropus eugenii]|uniref:uncharacterized protein n=1 Tax=Notamacropus eugenii TaxID=9315 RepID=UPI003B66CB0D
MGPEILQLLLLLLLSLGNSGKPGKTWAEFQPQEVGLKSSGFRGQENQADEEHRQLEEETFRVNCSYKFQEHDGWMHWCKKKESGEDCNILGSEENSNFSFLGNECLSSYDRNSGIMTIMIYKLRVNNSGIYECGILDSEKKIILKRFHLVISPATTFKTTECSQPSTEMPVTTSAYPLATSRSLTLSTVSPDQGSSEKKSFILGVVLSCLLLSVLLVVGIICTRKICQKEREGNDSETQGQKSKGSSMKMDSDAEDIHYATVSNRSPRELTNVKTHNPVESVEYATITRN